MKRPYAAPLALSLVAGLVGALAGCTADDAALEARICAAHADCPPGRACLDGACVVPDAEQSRVLCQGDELRTVRVTCDDYQCDSARIDVLDRVDCSAPLGGACDGERLVEQRGGRCDPALNRCVYPVPRITDCLATRVSCDGDLRVTDQGGGCDPEAGACRSETTTEDCRATIDDLPTSCESNRFLSRAVLADDVAACDPLTIACRTPDIDRVDCTADAVTCAGNSLEINRNGRCVSGRCDYATTQRTACEQAPEPTCDGDLLIERGEGGICDPVAGACRYPDPTVEDCARERASCEGDTSSVRPASACSDGACQAEAAETDCTRALPAACVEGVDELAVRHHPGGVCERGSGRCVYPDPTVVPCATEYICAGGVSQITRPETCRDGMCQGEPEVVPCAPPAGYCLDSVAYNYDQGDRCAPDGRCMGPDVGADRGDPCPDELFCEDNQLFGPGEPSCAVDAVGRAGCRAERLLDCNFAPAPSCDGNRRAALVGPGVCDAVRGCRFGEPEITDCAACLPAGAICVLPGTVRLPGQRVDIGSADDPRPARYDEALVMTTTEISRGEVARLTAQGVLAPLLGPAPAGCGDNCPATGLSWLDAVAIANARSNLDRLTPCYGPTGRVVGGAEGDPYLCEGWRLPTEVEWLSAWRAGTETRWPCGDDPACLDAIDAHLASDGPRSVGAVAANGAGLYDLGGNAREWMHDASAPLTGGREPYGPEDGTERILRGGSWLTGPDAAEATARASAAAHIPVEDAAVRLVRSLAPRPPAWCVVDPVTEQTSARVVQGRGSCALTPGVPCAYEIISVRCDEGCRAGVCLRAADLVITSASVDGVDVEEDDGGDPDGDPEGGGDPDGDPEGGGGDPPDGDPDDPGEGGDGPFLPVPLTFAAIPAGVFTHGAGADARRTIIGHDFWLMTTELAYVQFQYLLGEGGLEEAQLTRRIMRNLIFEQFGGCRENLAACLTIPAFGLTWLDAVQIANNLSASQGLDECYDESGRVVGGVDGDPQSCLGYRLPTEAEWVYAARAGATTTWACGDDPLCLAQTSTYFDNSGVVMDDPADCPCRGEGCPLWTDDGLCRLPTSQDASLANAWGLIDMSGNLPEWVTDLDDGSGPALGGLDPYRGPSPGARPVLKGGAWYDSSDALRLDARAVPDGEVFPISAAGVRLARTIPAVELPTARIQGPRSAGDITVTGSFEITTHEVTREAAVQLGARDVSLFGECGPDCAINWIDRQQATAVANALSLRQGLPPCYTASGGVRASAGDDPYRCAGWRLPTEAEWRVLAPCDAACAAEQGWTLCTSGFDDADDLDSETCTCDAGLYGQGVDACDFPAEPLPHPACQENSVGACFGPRPVATRPADADGLYDRAGSLREWLHDRWSAAPPSGEDPYGPADAGPVLCGQLVRDCFAVTGGSWADPPTAIDARRPAHGADAQTGFRLVRSLPRDGAAE